MIENKKFKRTFLLTIEVFANVLLWVSGTLLAIYPQMAKDSWVIFLVMLVGQILWGISAFIIKKWTLLSSSIFFALLNIYGVFIRF